MPRLFSFELGATLLALSATTTLAAPPRPTLWVERAPQAIAGARHSYASAIERSRCFMFDAPALRATLAGALGTATAEIVVPLPDGRTVRLRAMETALLSDALRGQMPEVRTYTARGADNPRITARLELTRLGFRGMIMTPEGTAYLDPMIQGREDVELAYWDRDARGSDAPFECEVAAPTAAAATRAAAPAARVPAPVSALAAVIGDTLRTYRYAVNVTGEFTQKFGGGDTLAAAAQVVTLADRVDAVYERDLGIHIELVWVKAFADPATDPWPDNRSGAPDTNDSLTLALLGSENYDLGVALDTWLDTTTLGFTGATGLPGTCLDGKAFSWIRGFQLIPEYYRVMMHEMGHQFGTNHTNDADCNRDVIGPFEPASGTTIMARAGRCGAPYNIQQYDDHYFHEWSIRDIQFDTRTWAAACAAITPTDNHPPTAEAGPAYTIPRGTPFVLTGSGSDPDPGDVLSYCWEEADKAPAYNNATLGPLFRSRLPTDTTWHAYPAFPTVLANASDPWEKLPTVDRSMKFYLTVRDGHLPIGGVGFDSTLITVSGAPFVLTSPNGGNTLASGTPFTVTWTVGGGSVAPSVNILLSTDAGATWAPLAVHVPNNGSRSVTAYTATTSTKCRIKVEASGNIFYDVSNTNFTLNGGTVSAPPESPVAFALHLPQPNPSAGATRVGFDLPRGEAVDLAIFSIAGQRVRTLAWGEWPAGTNTVSWDGADENGALVSPGVYFLRLDAGGARANQRVLRIR